MGQAGKLSQSEFAKLIGVDQSAVSRAVKTGRLVKSLTVLGNGKYEIDPVLGKAEFEANKKRGAGHADRVRATQSEALEAGTAFTESERKKKLYDAELARLKFEKESGRLLDAEFVKRQAFKAARATRDAMLGIPDRLSAELAGEKDQFTIRQRLDAEIRLALENLTEEIEVDEPVESEAHDEG